MALQALRSALAVVKEKGLGGAFQEAKSRGFLKGLLDGNLGNSVFRVSGAKLVGVDKNGNRYYEKTENTQFGRHRWVVYADKDYNASAVPPEWHGWLHYITDHKADQLQGLKPSRYGLEHTRNRTGEGEEYIYHAKGHALNPNKRDWKRYESWQPAEKDT
ncbi:unnamed protein product [Calypogeia fissa]